MVRIEFKDDTTAIANVVLGCDGIHSSIRSQFTSDNPAYSGRIAYRGLVAIEEIEEWWPLRSYSASWLCKDKHLLVFPISRNRLLNIIAFVTTPIESIGGLKESWTATGHRTELEADFKGFEGTVQRIIASMPAHPSKWLLNDREPLDEWVFANGKIMLLGDAAHAMLPHQGKVEVECLCCTNADRIAGAGAGQAIEDGYVLGRAIHDFLASAAQSSGEGTLEPWAHLYQSVRLPRAQKAQRTAREAGDVYEMQADSLKNVPYDDCIPVVRDMLKDRMKWVWSEDVDEAYDRWKAK